MPALLQIRDSIKLSLLTVGISDSEAEAEAAWIIAHVSGLSAAEQITHEQSLPQEWHTHIQKIVGERQKRKPLQHILGYTYFYGLKLCVEPSVFIPRQDTETVVTSAIDAITAAGLSRPLIADIGTGSGAIAIAILKHIAAAQVIAVDISASALALCCKNAAIHAVEDRITFLRGDWRQVLPAALGLKISEPTSSAPVHRFQSNEDIVGAMHASPWAGHVQPLRLRRHSARAPIAKLGLKTLDIIVSNPPYIPWDNASSLAPEIIDHEPHEALFGVDADGLDHYRSLARFAPGYFGDRGGTIILEMGDGQYENIKRIFSNCGWHNVKQAQDLNGVPRAFQANWTARPSHLKKHQ